LKTGQIFRKIYNFLLLYFHIFLYFQKKIVLTKFYSSQVSKCSEASVIEEERNQINFDKLVETVESISTERIKSKKPVKKKSVVAVNDVAKIISVVVKTINPDGATSDNLKLASEAFNKLKKQGGVDESLAALIEHYENVTNPEIKRSLLGEISKKLSLPKIRKIVRSKITTHE
jgi:hypothetical protein